MDLRVKTAAANVAAKLHAHQSGGRVSGFRMPGIPAAELSDDVLVRYEHPQLLSKKEVRGAALAYVSPAPQRNGSIFRPPAHPP